MTKLDRDAILRTFIMGALIEKSGQQLMPDVIGDLTKTILEYVVELIDRDLDADTEINID
jgi:hypothetical protein